MPRFVSVSVYKLHMERTRILVLQCVSVRCLLSFLKNNFNIFKRMKLERSIIHFISPEPKAPVELIGSDSNQRSCVPPAVRGSVCSHFQILISLRPAGRLKSNFIWSITEVGGGGRAACGLGPDRVSTLIFMATDSFHRVIMEKIL